MSELNLTKDIHFPKVRAIYEPPKKRTLPRRIFKFLTYRRKWEVQEDYIIWSDKIGEYVFIPKGFIFDGASVPKILYSIYSPNGILLLGAAPHDLGYRYQGLILVNQKDNALFFRPYSKDWLDLIFDDFCSKESGLKIASKAATIVLGGAGYLGWYENRKKNCNLTTDFPNLFEE